MGGLSAARRGQPVPLDLVRLFRRRMLPLVVGVALVVVEAAGAAVVESAVLAVAGAVAAVAAVGRAAPQAQVRGRRQAAEVPQCPGEFWETPCSPA
jgi:hypothetical protein